MSNLRSRLWRDGVLVTENFPLDDLDTHLASDDLVWFDICTPDGATLDKVSQELKFDAHAVEDAIAPGERAKAQRFATHTFVSVYSADLSGAAAESHDSRLQTHRISAFLFGNALVTVRRDEGFDLSPVLANWDENTDLIRRAGVAALLYGLLDVVVDGHFATIQQLDDRIEEIEDQLFDDTVKPRAVQEETYRLRKELVELRRVVLPMREIVATILRHQTEDRSEGVRSMDSWWQDLMDHVLRASEWTESLRDMVTSLFETNLSLQDSRLNIVMKRLAGWGAVIAVPTAVTGWFGQNVPYPGFSDNLGFALSCILTFGGSVVMYFLLKRVDWI